MISIIAEPSIHEHICLFHVDQVLTSSGPFTFKKTELVDKSLQKAPFLKSLFDLPGVSQVMIERKKITIAKEGDEPWALLAKKVGQAVRQQIQSHLDEGRPLIPVDLMPKVPDTKSTAIGGGSIKDQIQDLLDKEVNPAVASHGGHIELADVRNDQIFLKMSGGCRGCSSAKVTLTQGVERAIRAKFPHIREIIDVTDHAGGTNPFYS